MPCLNSATTGESADFSAIESAKIAQIFKNSSCRFKTDLNYKVVFIILTRHPTFDYGSENTDKYPFFDLKSIFNFISLSFCDIEECQICCDNFFTNKSSKLYLRCFEICEKTSQIVLNSCLLAIPVNSKILKNESLNNHNFVKSTFQYKPVKYFNFNILLRSGDIESNPGPNGSSIITVSTYNVRGLKNRLKLKRVLNTCHKLINENSNSFIFLQETHLESSDKDTLDIMWHHKYLMSPGTNRQCGCLILFDPSWEVISTSTDDDGRVCVLILKKFEINFILTNIYAPNNHDVNFFSYVFNKLIEAQTEFPISNIILAGDFNLVLSENDSANRVETNSETQCRLLLKRNLKRLDLKDSYRLQHVNKGFTWSRGSCMSRLDMIFVSKSFSRQLINSRVDWSFDDSDHARLESSFRVNEKFIKGPGLIRINADILDHEDTLAHVKSELEMQLNQIPGHWDPHFKLDFVKSALRSIISVEISKKRKIDDLDYKAITEQINTLTVVKEKLVTGEINNQQLLDDINQTLKVLEEEHNCYLNELSKKLCARAQSKWFEDGERSNKYFLNIIKKRSEQTLITKLATEEVVLYNQQSIMHHITDFYRSLYDEKDTDDNYDDFLSDLPSLNDEDREFLDKDITLDELRRVINECGDSSPGPDGIPYKVYRKLWTQLGPILLESWKYSVTTKILPYDQRTSAITLLPKLGKNLEKIENWRPITLTNCDLKIFTKLISNRVSKVLEKLIHPCQTAYIPGRVVHDNLRVFEFYNNYCKDNNVDALLISLDAKKAFDSVSHKYMHKVLSAYGFSEEFIDTVKLLYKDIQAQILVNGYKSVMIKILRSVKQGDALSCALFILCIDPLIRKIDTNPNIKPVQVAPSRYTDVKITNKICGFADDIGMAVNNDRVTIENIFAAYDQFSNLSGIQLNLDKTEILSLNHDSTHQDFIPLQVQIKNCTILTKESIKICGIHFSNSRILSYEKNILDKIEKDGKTIDNMAAKGFVIRRKKPNC